MQCIHPRASSQFELTAAELREVDAAILVLWGVFWWVWSAMDGWMDGWHLSSLALTLVRPPTRRVAVRPLGPVNPKSEECVVHNHSL